jgi:hypothetical protein
MGGQEIVRLVNLGIDDAYNFAFWLGFHPTTQDFIKSIILVVFVLATLMVVGDVYRGEIQNKLHRVKLVATPKKDSPPLRADADIREIRRRMHRERDEMFHLKDDVVPTTLNQVYSNALFYYRYRDYRGRIKTRQVGNCRVKLKVRLRALASALAAPLAQDHIYSDEEKDAFSSEQETPAIMSMAGSQVDYLNLYRVQNLHDKVLKEYETIAARPKWLQGTDLTKPERIGLLVKFHFPINPYFLLYKHPDTNVKTTAWLTVLTSVFALFMQLMFNQNGGEEAVRVAPPRAHQEASVDEGAERPAMMPQTTEH